MIRLTLELVLAPALVGVSTLACRRWSARIGGLLSAFPAVVGPLLLITAQERGTAFTATTAAGTLLGLIALAGFVLAYARVALSAGWSASLLAGWLCAATVAVLVGLSSAIAALPAALTAAALALAGAHRAMPTSSSAAIATVPLDAFAGELAMRMIATTVLVVALAAGARLLGPLVGGMLAGLPVLASVLAVFTHRSHGAAAVIALLHGMLTGMAGFVAFCLVVAALIVPAGTAAAFAAATVSALALHALVLKRGSRPASGPLGALET